MQIQNILLPASKTSRSSTAPCVDRKLRCPGPGGSDDDFPADGSLLLEKQAARYLDMECLAMIGMVLAQRLAGKDNPDMAMLA